MGVILTALTSWIRWGRREGRREGGKEGGKEGGREGGREDMYRQGLSHRAGRVGDHHGEELGKVVLLAGEQLGFFSEGREGGRKGGRKG